METKDPESFDLPTIPEARRNVIPEVRQTVIHKEPKIPVRYYIAVASALSSFFMFAARCNLSVAIVSMVADEPSTSNDTSIIIQSINHEKFAWTGEDEGIVLGSYFYGYTAFQIITGVLSDKLNVIHLNIAAHIFASLLSIATPFAARAGVAYIAVVRALLGTCHAPILASLCVLYSKWFPPNEIAIPLCLMLAFSNLGVAAIMPFTAWICELDILGGWPFAFYLTAAINFIIPVLWFFTVTSTPREHPFISKHEVNYIEKANSNIGSVKVKVQWFSILTSIRVWSIIASKGSLAFGYMIINTKIPAYLESELGMNLTSNGAFNAVLYIVMAVSQLSSAPIIKAMIDRGIFSRTNGRKVAEILTLIVPAALLIAIPFLGKDSTSIMIILVVSVFFMGFVSAGDMPIVSEMAPDLSGTIFGIVNTIGAASGFIAPTLVGFLLDSNPDKSVAWQNVFFIGAGTMVVGCIIFCTFATSDPQPWGISSSRSTDSLASVLGSRPPRPKRLQRHPIFSKQLSAH